MLNPSRSLLLIATGAVLILPLAACAGRNKLADTAYVAGCGGFTSCYYGDRRRITGSLSYKW